MVSSKFETLKKASYENLFQIADPSPLKLYVGCLDNRYVSETTYLRSAKLTKLDNYTKVILQDMAIRMNECKFWRSTFLSMLDSK